MLEQKTIYQSPSLKQFSSFEEMDEDTAMKMASISPIEHLKNASELIIGVYKEILKQPMSKRIKFKE
ncbi:MAG: hypothetical protein IT254_00580 [Chitinophagaceae bacterium]|nr:hypothetical protein [Chitinophagaceae bacterium]